MKHIKIIDTEVEEKALTPEPNNQAVDDLVEVVEALDEEPGDLKPDTELTLKAIQEMELAKADATREDGSSLPLVSIGYGSEGIVNSLARDLALNVAPLPVVEVKLLPPLTTAKLSPPEARPYDGRIHELFLDSREFNVEQALFTIQSNLLATPLPYPDASIEKFNSPEGAFDGTEPIAIYGNYIEDYTSPGAGASSVHIVSMTFNNQVHNPDANGKIIINTSDGQLVMYTNEVGLNQDFPGNDFKPGFFYYVETSHENHAPGNGENLFDHNMSITIANNLGQTATGAFNIHIIDDVPIAHDDIVKLVQDLVLEEGGDQITPRDGTGLPVNQVSGNLLLNDDYSVDGPHTIKQVTFQFEGDSHTYVLSNGSNIFSTDFGLLIIDTQGNYTYDITAILPSDHVTEDRIKYQVIDNDGDTSDADLLLRMAPAPVITLVPNDPMLGTGDLTVSEGPNTSVQYKVVVTGILLEDLSFTVETQDSSAYANGNNTPGRPDYVTTSTIINIPADEINSIHEVTLPPTAIVDDEVFENNPETFDTTVVLIQGNINSSSDTTIVTTVKDDDPPPKVSIQSQLTVSEGNPGDPTHYATLTITMTGSSQDPVTFHYATQNGLALSGAAGIGSPDYVSASGDLTFPSSFNVTQTFTINIPIVDDLTYEHQQETFLVNLTPVAMNGAQFGNTTAVVTINDNDSPPTLTVTNVSVSEGAGGVDVVINRIGGSTETITFKLSTADITTTAGSDYTSLNPNTIYSFPPSNGNSSMIVHIPVTTDGFVEPNETFGVNITPVSGAVTGVTNGVVTIINDDIAAQANNDNVTVDPSSFAAYNITFILDTSGSMGFAAGTGTRLDVLKAALNDTGNLLDTYYALSNGLHVNIIEFNSNAAFISQKNVNDLNDLDAVKNDIDDLSPSGGTNYEDALVEAIARFVIDDANSGLNGYINRSYFISDGEPTSGNEGDITAWQNALTLYDVQSFTANISAGTASSTYLNPIATQTNIPLTFVAANDLSNLDDFLLSTIAISGNVLSNDAVGSSGAGSVISYSYNNGANSATVGDIVTTLLGGKFVMYADGSYNYIPDGNNSTQENEIFHYNIQDPGGNQSSAILTLTLEAYVSPVVLDLNNNGDIELISAANSGVSFDVNHDGTKEHTGWVSPNDGILVYDPTDSGQVTDINQIAFTSYVAGAKTDLEGLRFFDSNHDGKLDVADEAYSHFGVWQDINSNAVVDSGEYSILDQAGITSLSLASDHNRESDSGNMITGYTTYQTSDGLSHLAADVSLSVGASIPNQSAAVVVTGNDILPASNSLDFSSLPESNTAQATAPLQVSDSAPAMVAAQVDATVTAALQQAQQETVVI